MNTQPFVPTRAKKRFQQLLHAWYTDAGRALPWRHTHDPYAILVSELMLQQTQVDRVLPKYAAWMKRFPTVATLSRARTKTILAHWQGLGYNRRALYLQRIARIVMREYNGVFPRTTKELLALPGIGPYTAGAIMSFAYNAHEPIVDTNVSRVVGRIFIGYQHLAELEEKEMWEIAASLLPAKQKDVYHFNQALMDFGALVCTATSPACVQCPMQKICTSYPTITDASAKELRYKKKPNETLYFGQPRRIWRGKILRYLHTTSPATYLQIGNAIQSDFCTTRIPWLKSVVTTLEKDGLVKIEKKKVALP